MKGGMRLELVGKKIGFVLTGSFCTFKKTIPKIKELIEKEKAEIIPIMSNNSYEMDTKFGKAKDFIEEIPVKKLKLRGSIPQGFRDIHPAETNEKYAIFRLYPAGTPNGTANPRVIGMIKNTIFYIFILDWKGDSYKH